MYTLLLALQLFTATPLQADIQPSIPHHYVSTIGYIDLTDLALPDDQLIWPTNVTKLTRGFSNGHTGMDVDARTGDPVYAAFPGTVTTVSHVTVW